MESFSSSILAPLNVWWGNGGVGCCIARQDHWTCQKWHFTIICQSTQHCDGWAVVKPGEVALSRRHTRVKGLLLPQRCSLEHCSDSVTAVAVNTGASRKEILSSSYYSAVPFSSVFFTSKSILTQCILSFVSLTDGVKDSQCCIVNNFSVAWLFPSVHISKPINSLLFSNGY